MKTGKRILSILLTALMLALSLATAAQADADPCAGGHDWSGWRQSQAATCDSPGSQERVCNRCYTRDTQAIPALGHSWNGGAVTAQPTCTSGGTRVYTCTRCGQTRTEGIGALGHSYGGVQVTKPSTCASMGESFQVCSRCGDRVTHVMPKNENHSWDEGVITREPDGFTPGEKTYTCTLCGATRTEEVEPVTGLFSNLNSLLSGGNFQNKIMSNPLGDDILHIVQQPQGGSIVPGESLVLTVEAAGGEEPYWYDWWYAPEEIDSSLSALADLVNSQGVVITDTVQQNRNEVKNATIASTSEWLSKHISFDGTSGSLTGKSTMETEPMDTTFYNPSAKRMLSSESPECYAWATGNFWCIVYDSAGHHVTSDKAKVTEALYILSQPTNKNIWGIGSATLKCLAGGGSGNYFYTWYDEKNIPVSDEAAFQVDQEGTYYCEVADYETLEVVDSQKAQVYSDKATQDKDLRPIITLHPSNVMLEYREDGKYNWNMACQATTWNGGSEGLRYTWFGKSGSTWAPIKEGEILTWSAKGGTYRCKVEDIQTGQYALSGEAKVNIEMKIKETHIDNSANLQLTVPLAREQRRYSISFYGGRAPYSCVVYGFSYDDHFPDFIAAKSGPYDTPYFVFDLPMTFEKLEKNENGEYELMQYQVGYRFVITDANGQEMAGKW